MKWSAFRQRAYADLFMPSRLEEYRKLLETALQYGYEVCSLRRFWGVLCGGAKPDKRYCVLRHDIDTGVRTAREMWTIEQRLGINSSYYFRLRTLAIPLMVAIEENGGEASYHFEEVGTVAKRYGIRHRDEIAGLMPRAQELFARNLARIREKSGLRLEIVAGHGDWVNRKLGIHNREILTSESFRRELKVELEAYDKGLMSALIKHSDTAYPSRWLWDNRDPSETIRSGAPAIQVLVHPRHWQVERVTNLMDDASRWGEELWYRLGH